MLNFKSYSICHIRALKLCLINIQSRISTHPVLTKSYRMPIYNSQQITRLTQRFLIKDPSAIRRSQARQKKREMLEASFLKIAKQQNAQPKRLVKLSKIFMENITSIISTSDIAEEVAGMGFEIVHVDVQPGLSSVHIYWICSNSEDDKKLNEILENSTSFLRHELNTLQILGRCPALIFIRDISQNNAMEVEKLLQVADFGEDFKPTYPLPHPQIPVIMKDISDDVWEKLSKKSENKNDEVTQYPSDLYPIRHDLYHIDREKIMKMVKKGVQASSGKHRESSEPLVSAPADPVAKSQGSEFNLPRSYSRTSEIRKWASRYKGLQKKASKRLKNESTEISYHYEDEIEADFTLEDIDERDKFEEIMDDYEESFSKRD